MSPFVRACATVFGLVVFTTSCTEEVATTAAPDQVALVEASGWDLDAALAADPNCAAPLLGDGLHIGYAADLSDRPNGNDHSAVSAVQLVVQQINCSGGFNGLPVSLDVVDVSGDLESAERAAQSLIDGGADIVLGTRFSVVADRIRSTFSGQLPVIWVGSMDAGLAQLADQSYLVSMDFERQADASVRFAELQGWISAVAVGPSEALPEGTDLDAITDVFARSGRSLPRVTVRPDDGFSDVVATFASSPDIDVVFSALDPLELPGLREQLSIAGFSPAIISLDLGTGTIGELAATEGVFLTAHAALNGNPRYRQLEASHAAWAGQSFDLPWLAAVAVDAVTVIAAAIDAYGLADPTRLGPAIANTNDISALTSTLSYEGSATPRKTVFIGQVFQGRVVLAGSID